MVFVSSLILALPVTTGFVLSDLNPLPVTDAVAEAKYVPTTTIDPAIQSIERLLSHYSVQQDHRDRVAKAIVDSSRKQDIDPKLVASIVIVESRANPFAISDRNSVGIMQIHIPTWGATALQENINLFKVEDNISFGTRILKRYVAQYGLWNGVARYKGWIDTPESQQNADEYVQKVKKVYQL
jgi:soluble lytic murein transglycosylase-like protein